MWQVGGDAWPTQAYTIDKNDSPWLCTVERFLWYTRAVELGSTLGEWARVVSREHQVWPSPAEASPCPGCVLRRIFESGWPSTLFAAWEFDLPRLSHPGAPGLIQVSKSHHPYPEWLCELNEVTLLWALESEILLSWCARLHEFEGSARFLELTIHGKEMAAIWRQMNTNCKQVLDYYCSGSRGKNTIRNSTLNTISSVPLSNLHAT
jgi:hypothetical protein